MAIPPSAITATDHDSASSRDFTVILFIRPRENFALQNRASPYDIGNQFLMKMGVCLIADAIYKRMKGPICCNRHPLFYAYTAGITTTKAAGRAIKLSGFMKFTHKAVNRLTIFLQ
ncbi:MAG: hypothetical protein P4L75_02085 [Clostridia bacterium]|nr:hypothetical protein [Clostridia bacterium]MDR3644086.1 hypothetical protein [Clostridia bacterium]